MFTFTFGLSEFHQRFLRVMFPTAHVTKWNIRYAPEGFEQWCHNNNIAIDVRK